MAANAVVAFAGVSKQYGALRPLRIAELRVAAGEQVALVGFDRPMAEVFVNLITGAAVPDAGEVTLFGRSSSAITDSADWLTTVDRFGIVSERAVLLEQLSAIQNLAMPFTLEIEPPAEAMRQRAEALAREIALPEQAWEGPLSTHDADARMRVHVGRAIAHGPDVLVLEHVSASLTAGAAAGFATDIRRIAERRGVTLVSIGADESFARAVAARQLKLEPATGRLVPQRSRWFPLG